ncbi:hypothetical protein DFH27DRAFT_613712 [Peziza echinospora]|nr:hypothetical protein DFH27DRAFT_613712 [Peziza echinospora]
MDLECMEWTSSMIYRSLCGDIGGIGSNNTGSQACRSNEMIYVASYTPQIDGVIGRCGADGECCGGAVSVCCNGVGDGEGGQERGICACYEFAFAPVRLVGVDGFGSSGSGSGSGELKVTTTDVRASLNCERLEILEAVVRKIDFTVKQNTAPGLDRRTGSPTPPDTKESLETAFGQDSAWIRPRSLWDTIHEPPPTGRGSTRPKTTRI